MDSYAERRRQLKCSLISHKWIKGQDIVAVCLADVTFLTMLVVALKWLVYVMCWYINFKLKFMTEKK